MYFLIFKFFSVCEYLRDFSDRMEGTEDGMELALPTPACNKDGNYEPIICTKKTIRVTQAQQRRILEEKNVRQMRMLLSQQSLPSKIKRSADESRSDDEQLMHELSKCPVYRCRGCEFGYVYGDDGCITCECLKSSEPPANCTLLNCLQCVSGYKRDSTGCSTCNCVNEIYTKRDENNCPLLNCASCEHGHKTDSNDCQLCECLPAFNKTMDIFKESDCPLFKCVPCDHGYSIDVNGCLTCDCLPAPSVTECSLVNCQNCTFGYKYDDKGCNTCECQETEYPKASADCPTMKCVACYPSEHKRDERGCLTCDCVDDSVVIEDSNECHIKRCKPCKNGYQIIENGCKSCDCIADKTKRDLSNENLKLVKVSDDRNEHSAEQLDVKNLMKYLRQNILARSENSEANYMAEILSRKLLSQVVQERSAKVIDTNAFGGQNLNQAIDKNDKAVTHQQSKILPSNDNPYVDVEIEECFCVDGFGTEIPRSRGQNVTLSDCQK